MNVDAFLASINADPKRGPRVHEEKHDPNESIESIVARMGSHVGTPRLAAPDDAEDFIEATLAEDES
jgi:hypothetical protein